MFKKFTSNMIISVIGILAGLIAGISQINLYEFNSNESGELFATFIILFPFLISFVCVMMLRNELKKRG